MNYTPRFNNAKVLFGIPAIENPPWWFVLAMQSIAYPVNFQKATSILWGKEVGVARNELVDAALKEDCEYLFFLDDDVIVPPNVFTQLYSHKKDIVSALYTTKGKPSYPLIFKKRCGGVHNTWKMGDLVKVWGCGMGATLINMRVFREGKITKPYFKTRKLEAEQDPETKRWSIGGGTEDLYFLEKAGGAGYETYVDTSIQCMHFDRKSNLMYPLEGFSKWYKGKSWRT
jgi:hypothetical protein